MRFGVKKQSFDARHNRIFGDNAKRSPDGPTAESEIRGPFVSKGRKQTQDLTVASVTTDVLEGCSAEDTSHRQWGSGEKAELRGGALAQPYFWQQH
jgi:hypothetical protein